MFKTGHPVCFSIKTGDSCGKMFHQYDCTPRSKKKKKMETRENNEVNE